MTLFHRSCLVPHASTTRGHLALQDRPRRLGNSHFGFASVHWKVEVMLGMELEVWARRCYLARDRRSAGIPRKRRVATQLSGAAAREPWPAEDSIVIGAMAGQ
jgi:hypothetical protein